MKRRVVITGMGSVSPLGHDVKTMWNGITACKSGIRNIDTFDTADITSKVAGLINKGEGGFNPDIYMSPSEQRKVDQFIVYATVAAQQAFDDAGFSFLDEESKYKTAVSIGSGIGGVSKLYDTAVTLFQEGAKRVSPFFIPSVLANLASGHIAIRFGFKGANYSIVSACASGTHSIGEMFRAIKDGYVDYALVGGAESAVCRLGISGFASARALSTNFNDAPTKASRPWDRDRDGFVIGEGAGVLALETLESAQKRGAKIYGEVIGYGASCDAYHITAPSLDSLGAIASMRDAIFDAGIDKSEIQYINAHGTSTPAGDIAEYNAVLKLFGDDASNLNMSSTKSAMGHLLGAAGAVEAIICLKAMEEGVVPATLNVDNLDEKCVGINLTPNEPQEKKLDCVMSNSFGFGGTNGSLIFKKI